eukprot:4602172-Prymnesium_polylepis.1
MADESGNAAAAGSADACVGASAASSSATVRAGDHTQNHVCVDEEVAVLVRALHGSTTLKELVLENLVSNQENGRLSSRSRRFNLTVQVVAELLGQGSGAPLETVKLGGLWLSDTDAGPLCLALPRRSGLRMLNISTSDLSSHMKQRIKDAGRSAPRPSVRVLLRHQKYTQYTPGAPLRIPNIKNIGKNLALEELRICP